jgi:hypothetical protein
MAGLAAACGQAQGGQPAAKPAPTAAPKPAAAAAPKAQAGGQQKTTNVWFNQATQLENFRKNVVGFCCRQVGSPA